MQIYKERMKDSERFACTPERVQKLWKAEVKAAKARIKHIAGLPAEKWTLSGVKESGWHVIGDKYHGERARVWSIRDARLICKAVNQYLSEGGKNG